MLTTELHRIGNVHISKERKMSDFLQIKAKNVLRMVLGAIKTFDRGEIQSISAQNFLSFLFTIYRMQAKVLCF